MAVCRTVCRTVVFATSAVAFAQDIFSIKSVFLETSEQSRWQMLVGFSERVVLQSSLRAPAQADLGQTLRVAVTFENDLPLSCKIDNIFVTFPRLTIFCPLCKPVCSYLQTEKDKDIYMCANISSYKCLSLSDLFMLLQCG